MTGAIGGSTLSLASGISSITYPIVITQGWSAANAGSMVVTGLQWTSPGNVWTANFTMVSSSSGVMTLYFYYQ
jgi:hypothetical protein